MTGRGVRGTGGVVGDTAVGREHTLAVSLHGGRGGAGWVVGVGQVGGG